jgi:putative Holliday junction resolvase
MAILAIDYGRKRLGLALSDASGVAVHPFAVWNRRNRRTDLARLREFCRAHGVGRIVVGWPLHLDGRAGVMAKEAARFAERLRKNLGLCVEMVDERLSSCEATQIERARRPGRFSPRRSGQRDDLAAAVILRDYFRRQLDAQDR